MISGDFSNFLNTQRFYLKCPSLKVSYNMNGQPIQIFSHLIK